MHDQINHHLWIESLIKSRIKLPQLVELGRESQDQVTSDPVLAELLVQVHKLVMQKKETHWDLLSLQARGDVINA